MPSDHVKLIPFEMGQFPGSGASIGAKIGQTRQSPRSKTVPLRPLATLAVATALFLLTVSEKPGRADEEAYDPHKIMLAKGRFEKGMKLLEEGKEAEGKMELDEALKLFPDYADAEIQLGNLSMRHRSYSDGLAHYLQAEAALSHLQGMARLRD